MIINNSRLSDTTPIPVRWWLDFKFDLFIPSSNTHAYYALTVQRLKLSKGAKRTKFYHITVILQYCWAKSRKYRGIFEEHSPEKNNDKFGKGLVSTSRTYASPKGTGPGVRRSKRPLSACHTRSKCSMETTQNSVKGRVWYKVWSVRGCHCIWSGHRMSFNNNYCERETSYCLIRSPYRP